MGRAATRIAVTLGTAAALLAATMALNHAVDPLWYSGGNKLGGRNFVFNERHSKINLLWPERHAYDCFIFGSSRATLLHQSDLKRHRCFNLAFSAATPPEVLAYGRYLVRHGIRPRRVIVAVDMRNFSRRRLAREIPDFVARGAPPPSALSGLVSLDAALFSIRTLLGHSPYARYYDHRFDVQVLPRARAMTIPACFSDVDRGRPFTTAHLHYYAALRAVFPGSEFVGYTAPISAWDMTVLRADGSLESYLDTQVAVARVFDRYYDFAVPSAITADPRNSYDGDHFMPRVNRLIAATLDSDVPRFGLALHHLSPGAYRRAFRRALDAFSRRTGPIPLRRDCGRRPAVR